MSKKLLITVLVLSIASLASAPASEYGFNIANGDWSNASNWEIYVDSAKTTFIGNQLPFYDSADPGSVGTNSFISGTVTVTSDVESRGILDGPGNDTVDHSAGTLRLHGFWFGEGGGGATYNLTGGTVLTNGPWGAAAEIGMYSGSIGSLLVSGNARFTDLTASGRLQIGSQTGTGHLGISDNAVVTAGTLGDFTFWKNTDGTMDIKDDGRLILGGNHMDYFDTGTGTGRLLLGIIAGNVTSNGVANPALFNVWFDGTNTIINAPEPATIALLGMGSLALIRRKRQL